MVTPILSRNPANEVDPASSSSEQDPQDPRVSAAASSALSISSGSDITTSSNPLLDRARSGGFESDSKEPEELLASAAATHSQPSRDRRLPEAVFIDYVNSYLGELERIQTDPNIEEWGFENITKNIEHSVNMAKWLSSDTRLSCFTQLLLRRVNRPDKNERSMTKEVLDVCKEDVAIFQEFFSKKNLSNVIKSFAPWYRHYPSIPCNKFKNEIYSKEVYNLIKSTLELLKVDLAVYLTERGLGDRLQQCHSGNQESFGNQESLAAAAYSYESYLYAFEAKISDRTCSIQ